MIVNGRGGGANYIFVIPLSLPAHDFDILKLKFRNNSFI